jgi:hypothetical protein
MLLRGERFPVAQNDVKPVLAMSDFVCSFGAGTHSVLAGGSTTVHGTVREFAANRRVMEPTDLKSNRSARLPGGRMSLDQAK